MPAMKALAYVTAELKYVGGAVVLTPTRVLTRYYPIQDYVKGTLWIEHLRVGIGREEIITGNFPNDYPVMKVVDNEEDPVKYLRTALIFVSISTKCLFAPCVSEGKEYNRKILTILFTYRSQTVIRIYLQISPTHT